MKTQTVTRIYHPWWDWECFKAGFYESSAPEGMTPEQAENSYREFLSNLKDFGAGIELVMSEWPKSCEHFLTNASFNRVAWLGQTAMCVATGVPGCFRTGFKLLTQDQQTAADELAQQYLDDWLRKQCLLQKRLMNTLASG